MGVISIYANKIMLWHGTLTIIGCAIAWATGWWSAVFLSAFVFFANEITFLFTGLDIYVSCHRTAMVYDGSSEESFWVNLKGRTNFNLSEGIHPLSAKGIPLTKVNTSEKSSQIAVEEARFEEFIKLLGLEPGDRVLDCGCGFGNMVDYFVRKGIDATGITISNGQKKWAEQNRQGKFIYGDYTEFIPELVGQFDCAIFPGSTEHLYAGNPFSEASYQRKHGKLVSMYGMISRYFDDRSRHKKILVTCLHLNPKYVKTFASWITERMFGGLYPRTDKYGIADALKDADYTVLRNDDYTWHYYYTSYADPSHFGNSHDYGLRMMFGFLFYPHVIYVWWYWIRGYWMLMFDGKTHLPRDSQDPFRNCDLSFCDDAKERPCTLFYTVAQAGPAP